jgi:hypothetical protein
VQEPDGRIGRDRLDGRVVAGDGRRTAVPQEPAHLLAAGQPGARVAGHVHQLLGQLLPPGVAEREAVQRAELVAAAMDELARRKAGRGSE